eukprot:TRINITY_DN7939_c0_g1_i2.p2 TRINITY_DN7939_c0_g1~~TRINITY_DN7939_c0_g1_i2.p2  ORF type:complete len:153 (-),score=36.72 TRINITY_DN7939_c0_g1_i2:130-588(-)
MEQVSAQLRRQKQRLAACQREAAQRQTARWSLEEEADRETPEKLPAPKGSRARGYDHSGHLAHEAFVREVVKPPSTWLHSAGGSGSAFGRLGLGIWAGSATPGHASVGHFGLLASNRKRRLGAADGSAQTPRPFQNDMANLGAPVVTRRRLN